jgi:hypothetical protein
MNYQNELKNKKEQLGDNSIENLIYALSMKDIVDPINRVLVKHNIDKSALSNLSCEQCKKFMDTMPTRRLDIHLHKQIFKNPNYRPKETDIGDWGGIGIASCYCDIVICEKHFADLLRREKYIPHARIETDLDNLILDVNPIKKPIKT